MTQDSPATVRHFPLGIIIKEVLALVSMGACVRMCMDVSVCARIPGHAPVPQCQSLAERGGVQRGRVTQQLNKDL